MNDTHARCALITGASQGLGRALAEECAGRGMDLVLVALPQTGLCDVASILARAYGVRIETVEADLTDPRTPRAIDTLMRAKGYDVDTLVNNAGIGFTSPFAQSSEEQNECTVQLNVAGLVSLTQQMLPGAAAAQRAWILNVASLGAFFPMPSMPGLLVHKELRAHIQPDPSRGAARERHQRQRALPQRHPHQPRHARDDRAPGLGGQGHVQVSRRGGARGHRGALPRQGSDRPGGGQPRAGQGKPRGSAQRIHARHRPQVGHGPVTRARGKGIHRAPRRSVSRVRFGDEQHEGKDVRDHGRHLGHRPGGGVTARRRGGHASSVWADPRRAARMRARGSPRHGES